MSEQSTQPEIPSLGALVGHREQVQADDTLESVHRRFASSRHDFLAVLEGGELLGLCARRDIGTLLGARFGFALYARTPVRGHLTSDAVRVRIDQPLTEVLQAISGRRDEHFYDDVLLVDGTGRFAGLIFVHDLVRLQTGLLLENIAELKTTQAEIAAKNRQMEDDLKMAREVQLAMLPQSFPACREENGRSLQFASLYEPAGGVGGDVFDVLPLAGAAAGIVICDVMGHGVRSALITSMVRTMIEELRVHAPEPAALLTELNAHLTKLLQRTGDMIFVTAAYGVIDPGTRRLSYAQAGHPTPLRWNAQTGRAAALPEALRIGGPALGLMDAFVYEAMEVTLADGDRLLFFTDGIFEADNGQGEEFGQERLAEALEAQAGMKLGPALQGIKSAAANFAGGRPFADDVCLVACELMA
ncbi:MAG TPA: SpoIIE family protein phosphatase [Opitutaceae bacterium]|nr:SpoIIE family protein phosphatase [Opitutaceae bacterium]